ncbi:MAG: hypothetical protein WCO65_01290 [bacterium]
MQEKDINQQNNSYKGQSINDTEIEAFYQRNNQMSFILKKTEKIVTAIYMVTDFMLESEPMRKELRTLGVSLLSKTRKISQKATEPDYTIIDDIKNGIDETNSFLNISITIGLVSEMNGRILINELEKIYKEFLGVYNDRRVSVVTHPGYANIILKQEMFEIPVVEIPKIQTNFDGQNYKGQEESKNVLYKKPSIIEVKKDTVLKTGNLGLKIARRNDVLNIVKSKGQVSIKDIILMLKDVSEKTIQRELFSLVKEGVLKKEGEKRWSVYKLV